MLPALLLFFYSSLVNDVRALIARNDLRMAEAVARAGNGSEKAAALSWLARAALGAGQYARADQLAGETRTLADSLLKNRKLDADPWLPTAVGAAIEVHSQALAAQGERSEAVAYLNQQLALYKTTSIGERIRKNLNLLTMEGKPAPALEMAEFLGPKPKPLAELRGHPVLLFFWAHWCADCKGMAPIVASLQRKYGPRGLVVIGPTRLYGYVAGGEDAAPVTEKRYIELVRNQYYGMLAGMPVPVSAANLLTYGVSSTPTLALVDSAGIVRYYHPGATTEADLAGRIEMLLAR